MSGQAIGTAVGFVAGFFLPGGPQVWAMIGGAIGGYVDPTIISGPRLSDAAQQNAIDGVPITFGYGTFPTSGNVIWRSELREVRKRERQGKGGSTKLETFTYLRSYAIGVCAAPLDTDDGITGYLQIKRNGKIVYDARPDADLIAMGYTTKQVSQIRVSSAKFSNICTLYLGDEAQMPDPVIESHEGVGLVAPFRGLAYIVVEEDDLTDMQGAIPQYQFVVSVCGTTENSGAIGIASLFAMPSRLGSAPANESVIRTSLDGSDWSLPSISYGGSENLEYIAHSGNSLLLSKRGVLTAVSNDMGDTWTFGDRAGGGVGADSGRAFRFGNYWFVSGGGATDPIQRSSDGITWSIPDAGTPARVHDAVQVGTEIWGVSGFAYVSKSEDFGTTWAWHAMPSANGTAYIEGTASLLVVAGSASSHVALYWSDDFANEPSPSWTTVTSPFDDVGVEGPTALYRSATAAKFFCASTLGRIAFSQDGKIWTLLTFNLPSNYVRAFTDGNGYTYGACNDGTVIRSEDGIDWEIFTPINPPEAMTDILFVGLQGTPIPGAPGWYVDEEGNVFGPGSETINRCFPILGEVVADLCFRVGLTPDEIDVSDLTDILDGYRIASEGGVDGMITPLSIAYFFDSAEWDGKLRFIKRGADPVFSLGPQDLAERDGDPIEQERVQEAELLRKQTVAAFCPEAGYTRSTQQAERRAGTVEAKGESLVEVPVVMDKDALAQIADKRIKVSWSEPEKFKFSLPFKFSRFTPTDVGFVTDAKGKANRMRLMMKDTDTGFDHLESQNDRQSAYTSNVTGLAPEPPVITVPGIIGPTTLVIMNLPVLTEADDELGLYLAATSPLSGWNGAQVDIATDGVNYAEAAQIPLASVVGFTRTALLPEISNEYLSIQEVTVYLPEAPESVDYETLLRYFNKAAVQLDTGQWEVLQYQTVTVIDPTTFTLSGLVRGRYNTTPGAIGVGATFVLLDASVTFVQTPSFMLGDTISVRATSYGTSPDDAVPQNFTFSPGVSQTEWTPHSFAAVRDSGTDDVTLSWVGRGRLGTETTARHSKYFVAYRIRTVDGDQVETYQTTDSTFVIPNAPPSLEIRVCAVNQITGAGPYTEVITI